MQEIPDRSPNASDGGVTRASGSGARARNRRRTYDDIYTAAMALFQERSFEDVTVDDICAAADVGKATFFRHFGSKFGLVDEFNQRIAAKIDDAIDTDAMSGTECLRRATEIMRDEWLGSASQMRTLAYELLQSGTRMSPTKLIDPMARNLVSTLIDVVRVGQERGEFSTLVPPHMVAPIVVFNWTVATLQWFDHRDNAEFERSIVGLVEIQLGGLRLVR